MSVPWLPAARQHAGRWCRSDTLTCLRSWLPVAQGSKLADGVVSHKLAANCTRQQAIAAGVADVAAARGGAPHEAAVPAGSRCGGTHGVAVDTLTAPHSGLGLGLC